MPKREDRVVLTFTGDEVNRALIEYAVGEEVATADLKRRQAVHHNESDGGLRLTVLGEYEEDA